MNISFENTQNAFAYKSTKALKSAKLLFGFMGYPKLVQLGTNLVPALLKAGLPIKGIIRNTIFKQFVGGETLAQTIPVAQMLAEHNVDVILDYGVEGKEGEENFDHATQVFIDVINHAASQKNIPFISIKVTGLASHELLQTLHEAPRLRSGIHDNEIEQAAWDRVRERMYAICEAAAEKNIGVLVDAEESWIQDPIDRLTMEMMAEFNKQKAVVFNTIQLYRHDRLHFLRISRAVAIEKNRTSPIQVSKEATDADYDEAVRFCMDHIHSTAVIIASHNEQSNLLGAKLLDEMMLPHNHPHVHFSQLYGMSDTITFNLAKEGFNVSKYLPFGPIQDVIPYLMRRAQENTSVSGQTGRELMQLKRELARRKSL